MKRISMILLAGLALACGDDSPTEVEEPFTGTWLWVSSVGGLMAEEHTPETEMVSIILDYDGHVVRVYHDDTLIDQTEYDATELPTFGPLPTYSVRYDEPLNAFPFDALDEHTAVALTAQSVRFDDPCCDRYSHTLVDAALENPGAP